MDDTKWNRLKNIVNRLEADPNLIDTANALVELAEVVEALDEDIKTRHATFTVADGTLSERIDKVERQVTQLQHFETQVKAGKVFFDPNEL